MWNTAASQDRKDTKPICESVNRNRKQWCVLSTDGFRPPSKLLILTQWHCTGTNLILHLGFPVKYLSVSCLFSTRGKASVLISFFMCFYLSSAYWDLCTKLAAMYYPQAFQCCRSGIYYTQGVTEIQAYEFPWRSFHAVQKHILKIHCVGRVQAPHCPFPYWRCCWLIRSFLAFGWKAAGVFWEVLGVPRCFPLEKPTSCYWGTSLH